MNTSVTLSLDTRRQKLDKSYPVILRISHGRNTITLQTGYDIQEQYWDSSNRKIKSSCNTIDNVTRVNNILLKKRSEASDLIVDLDQRKILQTLSPKQLKDKILGQSSKVTFFTYTQSTIDTLIKTNHIGNARNYENVLREIKKFRNDHDFRIQEINYQFLKEFEVFYLSKGLKVNGLSVYMRTIRAIFNRAIKDQIVDKAAYPFDDYSIKSEETEKRAISLDSMSRIIDLKLDPDSNLFLTRNLFVVSFYLMGTSFIDLAFLKKENIKNERIKFKRRKTGAQLDIALFPELEEILNYYLKDKKPKDYIFPIIGNDDSDLRKVYDRVLWAIQRHNKRLKEIAKLANVQENLTFYVSRHSFASIANSKGIPLTAISSMLTHKKLNTTQVYLAQLGKNLLDDYHSSVFKKD